MPGQQLTFHKRSTTHSGKCNLVEKKGAVSYGILYELDDKELDELDRLEGFGKGYRKAISHVNINDIVYHPFLYVAESSSIDESLSPFEWYKDLVIVGAQYHGLPDTYVAGLRSVRSITDKNVIRANENQMLLNELRLVHPAIPPLPMIDHEEPNIREFIF